MIYLLSKSTQLIDLQSKNNNINIFIYHFAYVLLMSSNSIRIKKEIVVSYPSPTLVLPASSVFLYIFILEA